MTNLVEDYAALSVHPLEGERCSVTALWQERNELGSEATDVSRLDPNCSLTGEIHDQSFPTDEERLHATDLVDGVLNAVIECDNVTGVDGDGLSWLNWNLLDGSKGVVPYTANAFVAGCLNEEHGFTAEEAFCTLELGVGFDVEGGSEVGSTLDEDFASWLDVEALDVTRGAWCNADPATCCPCREGVEEEGLSTNDHLLEALEQPTAAAAGLHFDAAHSHHGSGLDID